MEPAGHTTRDGSVRVGGARLAYTSAGTGPAVVFVHAGIADRRMWEPQLPAVSARWRAVSYDQRGFGESTLPERAFSHHDDLAALLDALDIESAHLVGCSIGGAVILNFAITRPDRAASLVLVNSAAPGFVPEAGYYEPPQWGEALAAMEAGDLERAAELDVEMWVDGPFRSDAEVPSRIREAVWEMDLAALRNEARREDYEEVLDPPAGTRLDEVRCPALVVLGELDMPDMRPVAVHLTENISAARFVEIPGTAHLPNMEAPEVFNRALLEFLGEA